MERGPDAGESLLETVMAVAVLGIGVVAVLGGMATAVIGTDLHDKQSQATAVLLSAAEALKDPGTGFLACASSDPTSSTYASDYVTAVASVPRPAGWPAPAVTRIDHWDGATFTPDCKDTVSLGRLLRLQQVTVTVTDPGGRTTELLAVVKRDDA